MHSYYDNVLEKYTQANTRIEKQAQKCAWVFGRVFVFFSLSYFLLALIPSHSRHGAKAHCLSAFFSLIKTFRCFFFLTLSLYSILTMILGKLCSWRSYSKLLPTNIAQANRIVERECRVHNAQNEK